MRSEKGQHKNCCPGKKFSHPTEGTFTGKVNVIRETDREKKIQWGHNKAAIHAGSPNQKTNSEENPKWVTTNNPNSNKRKQLSSKGGGGKYDEKIKKNKR